MKRMICLSLALSFLLSLAACGGGGETIPATTSLAQTDAPALEPTVAAMEATTEPTLSQEEQLFYSLPERVRQACELGLVELDQLEDLGRQVTIGEASEMLRRAYAIHHGSESKLMGDILAMDCLSEPAYLGWIGRLPICLFVEDLHPEDYCGYEAWLEYMVERSDDYSISNMMMYAASYLLWEDGSYVWPGAWGWYEVGWNTKMKNRYYEDAETGNALLEECLGQGALLAYSTSLYDRTTGDKVLHYDGNDTIDVEKILTVQEMAEMALRTYHAFYVKENPAPYAECTTANAQILTPELLNRETDLPEASCSHLPDGWHGVNLKQLRFFRYDTGHFDAEVYEYEIQTVKEAGFNYIGLQLDLSWLQGNSYTREDSLDGQLDLNHLEKLDQILAWCMERDIHLDIRATLVGGYMRQNNQTQQSWAGNAENAPKFAALWGVLAERYRDVPNTYLSFTVLDSEYYPGMNMHWNQQFEMVNFIEPAVQTIREVSPDRCMIVDVPYDLARGTEVVRLGIALSTDLTSTNSFFAVAQSNYLNPSYYATVQWGDALNGESLLNEKHSGFGVVDIAELAAENDLGFMVSGWGAIIRPIWQPKYPVARYSDETYEAYLTDVTGSLAEFGYGWSYEEWYGTQGVVYSLPLTQNVSYQQIGEYPLYCDTALLGFFQNILRNSE